jgi:SAM-dependent MidA family methyltransferase
MTLTEIIIQKIKYNGPISFHDFMEMSLYYPHLGYYTSPRYKIGKNGDYLTSPDYSFLFGEMIAKQIEEMWERLDRNEFTIVEFGAGTGLLCHDILNYFKNNSALYDKLNYAIIEKSRAMRQIERTHLNEKVNWYDSIEDIGKINGCILSNELLDNFSVHQVVMKDELMEVYVNYENDFVEVLKPAGKKLKDYFLKQQINLPYGFRTEINLEAIEWIKDIAASLKKGYVITIDYGYHASELYQRNMGTLTCYKKHTVNNNFYSHIGEQDITAHVNFSALNQWGLKNGLQCCGFTNQLNFLSALGFLSRLRKFEETIKNNSAEYKTKMSLIQTLLLDMGKKFKVLIQQKGVKFQPLSGLQFAQQFV